MSFLINSYRFGTGLLLDDYPAKFAFSLQKIRAAQTNTIRVRRTNDNAEQDIGFNGNLLDASALTTFTGSNSGEVVTVYDQSGNGVNPTQSTASKQPQIVNAGTIQTDGTDYGLFFDRPNADVLVSNVVTTVNTVYTVFAVVKLSAALPNYVLFLNGTANGYGMYTQSSNWRGFSRTIGDYGAGLYSTNTVLITAIYRSSTDFEIKLNGTTTYTGTAAAINAPSGSFYLGGGDFGDFFGGHILEFILYDTDQTSNVSAIESDIMGRYANI